MSEMQQAVLTLQVNYDEDGALWAEVLELPGCFASGTDMSELMEAVDEAVALYIEDNDEAVAILAKLSDEKVVNIVSKRAAKQLVPRLRIDSIKTHVQYEERVEATV